MNSNSDAGHGSALFAGQWTRSSSYMDSLEIKLVAGGDQPLMDLADVP